MCKCIALGNDKLAEKNTRIATAHSIPGLAEKVRIQTVKLRPRSRLGPVTLLATFCPFCGVKLDD